MTTQVQEYQYLWDGTAPEWALMRGEDSSDIGNYLIVNMQSKSAKLIENDDEARQVIQNMLDAGVRVVTPGNGF